MDTDSNSYYRMGYEQGLYDPWNNNNPLVGHPELAEHWDEGFRKGRSDRDWLMGEE